MKQLILLTSFLLFLTACQEDTFLDFEKTEILNDQLESGKTIFQQKVNDTITPNTNSLHGEKKIIKDGRLAIEVTEIGSDKVKIDNLLKKHHGYYALENLSNTDHQISYSLTIRVPSDNFEKLISEIVSGNEEIIYKEIKTRDITEEFLDLNTRLKNKENYLRRYSELLDKAKTINDIQAIQEKIRGLEEEIETKKGRLKYLSSLVAYRTLNLLIVKEKKIKYTTTDRANFGEKLKQSLSTGWQGVVDFFLFIFMWWPLWVFIIFLILIRKKIKIFKRKK